MRFKRRSKLSQLEELVTNLQAEVVRLKLDNAKIFTTLESERNVNEELRRAVYPIYKRGFPDGEKLEEFLSTLENILEKYMSS